LLPLGESQAKYQRTDCDRFSSEDKLFEVASRRMIEMIRLGYPPGCLAQVKIEKGRRRMSLVWLNLVSSRIFRALWNPQWLGNLIASS